MEDIRIVGVVDEEPFSPATWSGSSRYFFGALQDLGLLSGAVSSKPPLFIDSLIKLNNFHLNRASWRFAYHLDPALFHVRAKSAIKSIQSKNINFNVVLQVGAWFNFTDQGKFCVSYHDGNLARRLDSPYPYPDIKRFRIDRAFEYERRLYERLDLIFPMSDWLKRSFVNDFGVDESKIHTVYAGINMPDIYNLPVREYNQKNLLFVGKGFERKGGSELLRAFSRVKKVIPEATLTIIGPTLEGLPDGVINPGFISKATDEGIEKLKSYYLSASAFVLPTRYEPFGIAFAEAMAHGLPCIGTNNCAVPEIIDDGISGFLVEVGDEESLADRMIQLLQSEDLCRSFGKEGFARYRKHFNWPTVTKKIVSRISEAFSE